MGDKIVNVVSKGVSVVKDWVTKPHQGPICGNNIDEKRMALKNLVEKAWGVIGNGECLNSAFIGKLIEAENYGDTVDYLIHNKLIDNPGPDLKLDLARIKNYLDLLFEKLEDLIDNRSESQSSGHDLLGNVRRCLLFLPCFDKAFVFNLKRVPRLSVPNEVIPEKLEQLPEFLDIIKEASNHFLLKDTGREQIQNFPELDNLSRKPCFEGIKSEQIKDSDPFPIFKVVTNIDLLDFEQWEFMLLRYLSLRDVNLSNRENLNLNKLSSLKYLDLKHTKVKDCSWFDCLEKLQMLDLRYTYVKEIPDKFLEKLGKLQHLLLGYIVEGGENQLAGPDLKIEKLNWTILKTLHGIKQPDLMRVIKLPDLTEPISNLSNVVDLSVTELTTDSLLTFWGILRIFQNLTSLGLASHETIDINSIPVLPVLHCLRLYGVCQKTTFQIGLQGFDSLKKVVIGDMGMVETVQIGSAVFQTVATLKFSNLPRLQEVAYTDEQHPDEHHSLLRLGNSEAQVWSREVKPNKTIFLMDLKDFRVARSQDLPL